MLIFSIVYLQQHFSTLYCNFTTFFFFSIAFTSHHICFTVNPRYPTFFRPPLKFTSRFLYLSLTVHYFCFRSEFDSDFVSTSTYELSSVHVRSSTIFASAVVAAPYATVRTPLQVAFHVLALTKIGSRSKCQIKSAEFYCIAEFYLLMEY